jgi:RNA polymerase sigma-70 factor, ECF subfamily
MNRKDRHGNSSIPNPANGSVDSEDAALLDRIAHRDRDSLRSLFRRYAKRVQSFALRMTHDVGTAEEIVDDTFLAVWDRAATFRGDSRPSTWIFGIAYRRSLKALEYRGTRLRLASDDPHGDRAPPTLDPNNTEQLAENADWISSALRTLSAEHRQVLELAYYLELSCEEMAKVMNCPAGTVKSRLFNARLQMRAALERSGTPERDAASGAD